MELLLKIQELEADILELLTKLESKRAQQKYLKTTTKEEHISKIYNEKIIE